MKNDRAPREDTPNEQRIFAYLNRIAGERDIDRLLLLLADFGRDLIDADRCTVWLLDGKNGTLWSKAAHGVDRITIRRAPASPAGLPLMANRS